MRFCPRCGYRPGIRSESASALFHVLRDEYARAQGLGFVEAKDMLCVQYGVAVELGDDFQPPRWRGTFCEVFGRRFFRKSTLDYSKDEMAHLVECTQEAVHG